MHGIIWNKNGLSPTLSSVAVQSCHHHDVPQFLQGLEGSLFISILILFLDSSLPLILALCQEIL